MMLVEGLAVVVFIAAVLVLAVALLRPAARIAATSFTEAEKAVEDATQTIKNRRK